MIALTGNTIMLYCPKCRRTYEDGTQRFCDNDGGRLLPAPPRGHDRHTKETHHSLLALPLRDERSGKFIILARVGHTGVCRRIGPRIGTSTGNRLSIARSAHSAARSNSPHIA